MSSSDLPAHWADKNLAGAYKSSEDFLRLPAGKLLDRSGVLAAVRAGEKVHLWDNACGAGVITTVFHDELKGVENPTWTVTATDLSEPMIAAANSRAVEVGWKNYEIKLADAQDTKLPDSTFTHSLTSFGFGIFPKSDAALDEIIRSVIPGGVVAISTWQHIAWPVLIQKALTFAGSPLQIPDLLAMVKMRSGYDWASPTEIQELFTSKGFTAIKIDVNEDSVPLTRDDFIKGDIGATFLKLVSSLFPEAEREDTVKRVLKTLDENWEGIVGGPVFNMKMIYVVTTAKTPA